MVTKKFVVSKTRLIKSGSLGFKTFLIEVILSKIVKKVCYFVKAATVFRKYDKS